jgi:hypothetical protein
MVLQLLLPYLLYPTLLHVVHQVVHPANPNLVVLQVALPAHLAVPQVDQPAHHAELLVVHLAKRTIYAARFLAMCAAL